ncbi:MAG TPA: enolase C-terminal domain-like protein [Candidatus Limnocylindrales bacterium]
MPESDVTVRSARVSFRQIDLDHPFAISGRVISWFTLALVDVEVADRRGRTARGLGASVLSVPWSWPVSTLDVQGRDAILRDLAVRLAEKATAAHGPADPIAHWFRLRAGLEDDAMCAVGWRAGSAPEDAGGVPQLAAMLALGAVDNAIHDGWARAAGRPAHSMYGAEHLAVDLGDCLGDGALSGRYPIEFLEANPRRRLQVQHVVGVSDPLDGGLLGFRHLKVKLEGRDPSLDAQRLSAVARLAPDASLSLDPNEGYPEPEALGAMLAELPPDVFRAVSYVEQPFPRDAVPDPDEVRRHSHGKPVLLDEGLDDLSRLPGLAEAGWSGLVVKASKGQTPSLLCHSFARAHGLFVTVQDLTAVDTALEHSARLASVLSLSHPAFEYNSRQYAPSGNRELAGRNPELTTVHDGTIALQDLRPGLY